VQNLDGLFEILIVSGTHVISFAKA
jgi:hypothetical protein